MLQGGDFTRGNGTGGESIYGKDFPDEWTNGYIPHALPFLLSSANSGPDTNGSQFFITTVSNANWLDRKHVVFGVVEEGYTVVKEIEKFGSGVGKPHEAVKITDCGVVSRKKED
jgi:peptidylprolyl isomerase